MNFNTQVSARSLVVIASTTSSNPLRLWLVTIAALLLLSGCSHDIESFYPTLADADKDGAITHGWVPGDLLPSNSRSIRVAGDLSPSMEWCAFEFPPSDADTLRKNLGSNDVLPPSVTRIPSPGVSWWPSVLKGNLDVDKIHKAGFQIRVVQRPATSVTTDVLLFAIDWAKGRAFFYLTSR